jgi:hypothetical protein
LAYSDTTKRVIVTNVRETDGREHQVEKEFMEAERQ